MFRNTRRCGSCRFAPLSRFDRGTFIDLRATLLHRSNREKFSVDRILIDLPAFMLTRMLSGGVARQDHYSELFGLVLDPVVGAVLPPAILSHVPAGT